MNPYILHCIVMGYEEQRKEHDLIAWRNGRYNFIAFATVMHNAFSKNKSLDYPETPMSFEDRPKEKELSEEELQVQRELFMAQLLNMKTNFEITHPKEQEV